MTIDVHATLVAGLADGGCALGRTYARMSAQEITAAQRADDPVALRFALSRMLTLCRPFVCFEVLSAVVLALNK